MKRKIKILLCGDSMDVGGAETHIVALANALSNMGHSVTVAARYGVLCSKLDRDVDFADVDITEIKALSRLRELIKIGGFDIVHAHSRRTSFAVDAVRKSLPRVKVGLVVTAHALYEKSFLKDRFSVWGDECIAVSRDIERVMTDRYGVPRSRLTYIPN